MNNMSVLAFQISFEILIATGAVIALLFEYLYAKRKKDLNGGKKVSFYINTNTFFYLIHVLAFITFLLIYRSVGYRGPSAAVSLWSEVLRVHAVVFLIADRIVKIWILKSKQPLLQH